MKSLIESVLRQAVLALPVSILSPAERDIAVGVERPRDASQGDFASNVALRLAQASRQDPLRLAAALARALPRDAAIDRVEVGGAGFINFFLKDSAHDAEIARILAERAAASCAAACAEDKPSSTLRFAVALAEGPLSAEHGRGIARAATLARLLTAVGRRAECGWLGSGRGQSPAGRDETALELEAFAPGFASWEDAAHCEVLALPPVRLSRRGQPLRGNDARCGLRDIRAQIGDDATRLFFLTQSHDRPLVLDLELAAAHSLDNPLHCIQYAHARLSSIGVELAERGLVHDRALGLRSFALLREPTERALIRAMGGFDGALLDMAIRRLPHLLVHRLTHLARALHACQRALPLIAADAPLRAARLSMGLAAQRVLERGLALLGIRAADSV